MPKLKFAVICNGNSNRSMAVHHSMAQKGFQVSSFGFEEVVAIPGKKKGKPNYYEYTMSYQEIIDDLIEDDKTFYTEAGVISLLERNKALKSHPQRFQDYDEDPNAMKFDVIFTCTRRIFDHLCNHLETKYDTYPCHIINVNVDDNTTDAIRGAEIFIDMATQIEASEDLENEVLKIIDGIPVSEKRNLSMVHAYLG